MKDLTEALSKYTTLRDTIQSLKHEQDELGKQIKEALAKGTEIETDIHIAKLRTSKRLSYPIEQFRESFGDSVTLEVASIDRKKADALAKSGDLDSVDLAKIAEVTETVSLVLVPKK